MKNIINSICLGLACSFITFAGMAQKTKQTIYHNNAFTIYADSVVQGRYTAMAFSPVKMVSNYKSPANAFLSPKVTFKFSINGKDNEMPPGKDHHFTCLATDGTCETPVIKFGQQLMDDRLVPDNTYLKPETRFNIRLDMRDVLKAFDTQGFYVTFNGDKVYMQDFKGVYVAGSPAPLSWDFDNLANDPRLKMKDINGDGIFETSLVLDSQADMKKTEGSWQLTKDVSAFPQYTSPYPLSDAIYNMSLEEMIKAVEPDSTFRTGKEWAGVWTRDISYSIILSMAYLQPQVAKNSLLRKVKNGMIIQDTGTGGAYPASTDRIVWAWAAWELYKASGDKAWLKEAYDIIKKTANQDQKVAYDGVTGMVRGESSFLDWREQTYPKWMQPADIYESECLGTNAVHYAANKVLEKMSAALNDKASAAKYGSIAQSIKVGINKYLWMADKGYYGQFLYGRRSKLLSPRSEALGEALAVIWGIADDDKAKQVIQNTPVMDVGIPCIYPQIPGIPPYHNNAVWPFVQSYWAIAAAHTGNEAAVLESIAAIYRPAALWLTNKENFVASNGDFAGTQINSSNMLWSLSGNLALVHKVLFGIRLNESSISFEPFVPNALKGNRKLTNFRFRGAVYDIELKGYGNRISTFMLDGKPHAATLPATLKGKHSVAITLANNALSKEHYNPVAHYVSLAEPQVSLKGNQLHWNAVEGAKEYLVLNKGVTIAGINKTTYQVNTSQYGEYQVIAVDEKGVPSFASEPVLIEGNETLVQAEQGIEKSKLPFEGFMGEGFAEISTTKNTSLHIPITVDQDGMYTIDFRYANGNGPTNTENKCAIRTLLADGKKIGTLVLPQRGKGEWSNWGWSNSIQAPLTKGKHVFTISLLPEDENMNGEINQAMLDEVRLVRKG